MANKPSQQTADQKTFLNDHAIAVYNGVDNNQNTVSGTGEAFLPWKISASSGSVAGMTSVVVNSWGWMQASSSLATPVSYAWQPGGNAIPNATSNFYSYVPTSQGTKAYSVIMTGSDGQVVTKSFNAVVSSGCPGNQIHC